MVAMRYTERLSSKDKKQLTGLVKRSENARVRQRAQAVILSSRKYSIEDISNIFEVDRDSVSSWITKWGESRFNGLYDDPKSGRPPVKIDKIKKK
jgi:transposase